MKWLIDEAYPNAAKIVLVMDNLNTHTPASFYKVFAQEEAFRLTQRLELHDTPKHGSWHFTTNDVRIKLKHIYPEIKF